MTRRALLRVAALLACAAGIAPGAWSQACPAIANLKPAHLYGLWRAEFTGATAGGQSATLLFEAHPELAGSVRGAINRNGDKADVAGDVDDGDFTLEESQDGRHISATWTGRVADNTCGKEIRGTWTQSKPNETRAFVLRKVAD